MKIQEVFRPSRRAPPSPDRNSDEAYCNSHQQAAGEIFLFFYAAFTVDRLREGREFFLIHILTKTGVGAGAMEKLGILWWIAAAGRVLMSLRPRLKNEYEIFPRSLCTGEIMETPRSKSRETYKKNREFIMICDYYSADQI